MDLTPNFMAFSNPQDFVAAVWETSQKNSAASRYIAGVIDALRWVQVITVKDYADLYEKYVYRSHDGSPCSS